MPTSSREDFVNGLLWGAWKEMFPVFLRQQKDPAFVYEPPLPQPGAA